MMKILKNLVAGIQAGILIAIGGSVFLACYGDGSLINRTIGAVFFSVALLCICYKGYGLFTGKVGFLPEKHDKAAWTVVLTALLGNLIATCLCGWAIRYGLPQLGDTAKVICEAKLTQEWPQTAIRGVFCGILMYLAVSIFRDHKTTAAIVFCVPVFILSGFEHSIADMFYFAASGIVSWQACGFLWCVILSNAVGGVLLPLLTMLTKEKTADEH